MRGRWRSGRELPRRTPGRKGASVGGAQGCALIHVNIFNPFVPRPAPVLLPLPPPPTPCPPPPALSLMGPPYPRAPRNTRLSCSSSTASHRTPRGKEHQFVYVNGSKLHAYDRDKAPYPSSFDRDVLELYAHCPSRSTHELDTDCRSAGNVWTTR